MSELSALNTFLLTHNSLETLPNCICNMKSLKELDLSHNLLNTLPHEFTKSSKLVDVDLSGNQLVSVPPDLFKHLKNLERLKLAHNKFSCLPSFTGIPKPHLGQLRRQSREVEKEVQASSHGSRHQQIDSKGEGKIVSEATEGSWGRSLHRHLQTGVRVGRDAWKKTGSTRHRHNYSELP